MLTYTRKTIGNKHLIYPMKIRFQGFYTQFD